MTTRWEARLPQHADVIVVGAGHNGLVAAVLLARAGLAVTVVERADMVGGACRTEAPFGKVPGLRQSTGAYLLGLMPPELPRRLGLDIPVLRRDPHYFLPTLDGRYLLMGSDRAALRRQFEEFFSPADWAADEALQAELAALREDIAPTWLAEPASVEETAERHVRPELRQAFVDLCRGSVAAYLDRFGLSDEVATMYAVTDGLSGLAAGPDTPGSGHNFLVHNMCRLPGSDGTWMIVRGGMGTVTGMLAEAAARAGATIVTGRPATRILLDHGAAAGVQVGDDAVHAPVVLAATDPWQLATLLGADAVPEALAQRLAAMRRDGSTMKVNLALAELPKFACLPPGAPSPYGGTIHLLPEGGMDAVRRQWEQVLAGELPEEPTIEWYVHTTVDPSLQDDEGHHSSALFVQSVPYQPAGSDWAVETDRYVDHLLGICDRYAPGTSGLVDDVLALTPPGIEERFGITRGHIHHVDNAVAFADRMPYVTGVPGLYAGAAGCHPAGSVIGAAGHNAADRILADLGRPPA
ncbi:MAG: phytoene desaturase family protein [Frankiaceae bacterium]